jgi:hypothetical protein
MKTVAKSLFVYLVWSLLCWIDPAKPNNDIQRTIESFSLVVLLTSIWH